MRVLIAGCGDLGTRIGSRLVADGHDVIALRRRVDDLPGAFDARAADLTESDALSGALDGVRPEVVVYCAAAIARTEAAYHALYVDGPTNLSRILAHAAPTLLIYCSSTAVYGQDDGALVDETAATAPLGFTGQTVLEGERRLAHAAASSVALRLGGIYGPGRTRMLDRLREGEIAVAPHRQEWTNRIHVDDAARAVVHVIGLEEPEAIYNVVDNTPATRDDVLRGLAKMLSAPPPAEIRVDDGTADRGKRVLNARLCASGFAPLYPSWLEGYADVIGNGDA